VCPSAPVDGKSNTFWTAHKNEESVAECHIRDFLLKFAKDKDAYREKLREGVRRFNISLLDYCETDNHVHLLGYSEETEHVSQFMQMVHGEFAQAYNRRKNRSGAFWADRFHSTMIQPGRHLEQGMIYLALNMVRCGVVEHPRLWEWCGYHELMGTRQRFRILDLDRVLSLLGGINISEFREHYEWLVKERIAKDQMKRESQWTEAIAVGSESFVREMAARITGRQKLEIQRGGENWILKEAENPYHPFLAAKSAGKR
jgi:putative transposase